MDSNKYIPSTLKASQQRTRNDLAAVGSPKYSDVFCSLSSPARTDLSSPGRWWQDDLEALVIGVGPPRCGEFNAAVLLVLRGGDPAELDAPLPRHGAERGSGQVTMSGHRSEAKYGE